MCLTLMVLGEKHKNKQKRIYSLSLADLCGKEHMIQALGLDSLTKVESAPKVMKLKLVNRPHRKVNIMLGMALKSLHWQKGSGGRRPNAELARVLASMGANRSRWRS